MKRVEFKNGLLMVSRSCLVVVLGVVFVGISGCQTNTGIPKNMRTGDAEKVENLVRSLSDKAANSKDFATLFAEDAEPKDADRRITMKYFIRLAEGTDPEFNGETATVQVAFEKYVDDQDDPIVTVFPWECRKEDEETWVFTKGEFPSE